MTIEEINVRIKELNAEAREWKEKEAEARKLMYESGHTGKVYNGRGPDTVPFLGDIYTARGEYNACQRELRKLRKERKLMEEKL